ncbi:MAG: ribonuclease P protein component [Myxococcales bacterium]|nr:ribonuclease P protein component [Myxococcales bacterium]
MAAVAAHDFPKSRRLLTRAEFTLAQRRGAGARMDQVLVRISTIPDAVELPAKLGIIASRKVGGAVVRNRLKRCVREWFRHRRLPPGHALLVILLTEASLRSSGELRVALDAAVSRALGRLGQPRS